MGCISKLGKAVANWVASLLQMACAAAIIYFLYQDLYKVDPPDITNQSNILNAANATANSNSTDTFAPTLVSPLFNSSQYNETCYLSEEGNKENACKYALSVVIITFAACIALSIIQCFTCNCCGLGSVFDTILSIFLCVLWAYFAVALTKDHRAINDKNPQPVWNTGDVKDARSIVLYLSWAEVALFAFTALVGVSGMCGGGGGDSYKV